MPKPPVNEAPWGVAAWVFIIAFNIAYVWFVDRTLVRHNFEYMTTEFAEALGTTWGPMLLFMWIAAFLGLTGHFIQSYQRMRGR